MSPILDNRNQRVAIIYPFTVIKTMKHLDKKFLIFICIAMALLLVACGGDSKGDLEILPVPVDQVRRYAVGDIVDFTGTLSDLRNDPVSSTSLVDVRLEFLPGTRTHLDKETLLLRTTVYFIETGEEQVSEKNIWQESDGELFELTDDFGNFYVSDTPNHYGLISLPPPVNFGPNEEQRIDFHTEYGGHVSGAVTIGIRNISLSDMEVLDTPLGMQQVYRVQHRESYQYQFSYVDYKRDASVSIDRELWVSPTLGLVRKLETQSEYSPSGSLDAVYRWQLDLESTNF